MIMIFDFNDSNFDVSVSSIEENYVKVKFCSKQFLKLSVKNIHILTPDEKPVEENTGFLFDVVLNNSSKTIKFEFDTEVQPNDILMMTVLNRLPNEQNDNVKLVL